jgi:hypothetical protein
MTLVWMFKVRILPALYGLLCKQAERESAIAVTAARFSSHYGSLSGTHGALDAPMSFFG